MSQSPLEHVADSEARDYFARLIEFGKMILRGGSFSGREKHCMFLNTRGEQFANVSAVSGLDFDDDGRGVALVDWDHDGDLDMWISNRTGPQLRFMRNDVPRGGHFLAVRLHGVTANRDGIGARLALYLEDDPDRPILRTLRAGEGFLAQSSKWVHFGLGESTAIERIVVRWPGGEEQTFRAPAADRWYVLTQGDAHAVAWTPPQRQVSLEPRALEHPKDTAVGRVLLLAPAPMPLVTFTDFAGKARSLEEFAGKPVLINLWATWCAPCMKELSEFTARAQTIRDAGVHVVALSVDGHGDDNSSAQRAGEAMANMKFPFDSGAASPQMVEQLEIVRNRLFDWRLPLPLPTSFLVGGDGQLAAVYYGPVDIDQLVKDVGTLGKSARELQSLAPPVAGRWLTPPRIVTVDVITKGLAEYGHHDQAAYVLEHFGSATRSVELAQAHFTQARSLEEAGRLADALPHYRQALELTPDNTTVLMHAGLALGRLGRIDEAARLFERLVQAEPENAHGHYNLGLAVARLNRVEEARARFAQAVALDPRHEGARMNLGVALEVLGRPEQAWTVYRDVLAQQPANVSAVASMLGLLPRDGTATQTQRDELVRLAERANSATGGDQPAVLDLLAQVYAGVGRLDLAVRTAELAAQKARAAGATDMARQIEQHLAAYRAAGGSP